MLFGFLPAEGRALMEPVHIHIPYPKLKDFFEMIRARRYDLEIYMSAAVLDQIEKQDLESLLDRLDWNPKLTLHAPFMDLNPGAIDPMVRSVTQVRFRQLLTVAAILKPRSAVFHAAYDRWRYSGRRDVWLDYSVDTWYKVMDSASKIGLRVAVENVFDEDPEALQMLIEKINNPDFGFCFDTGHFNIFSSVTMERWFEVLGRYLVEVHLHDNDGTSDAHWALGRGKVDFDKFFALLNVHSPMPVFTIEAHDKDDVEKSLERVKTLFNNYHRPPAVS
jgi:sugar phosphate isomerase/epimerase